MRRPRAKRTAPTSFTATGSTTTARSSSEPTDARTRHAASADARDTFPARFVRNLAPQDWYIAGYFVVMMLAVVFGSGPDREHCERLVAVDFACLMVGLALTRGGLLRSG